MRPRLADGLAHDLDPARAQIGDRRVDVVDVEGEVVPTDVAVARLRRLTVGGVVLEHLEVRAVAER